MIVSGTASKDAHIAHKGVCLRVQEQCRRAALLGFGD